MLNTVQNRTFGSRIIFSEAVYADKDFATLYKKKKSVEAPWTIKDSKILSDEGYSTGIKTCLAGILKAKGGKEFFIFHLNPDDEQFSWSAVKKHFLKAEKRLKKDNPNAALDVFLLGAKKIKGIRKTSANLAQNALKFFEETGVNISALLFQKMYDASDLYYSLPKDEIVIFSRNKIKPKKVGGLRRIYSKVIPGHNKFEFEGK